MFDPTKLKTACIYHIADLDGHSSGAMVRYFHRREFNEDVLMVPADYHYDGEKIYQDVKHCDKVYIVDFSMIQGNSEVWFRKLLNSGTKVIWIDHHKSAIEWMFDRVDLKDEDLKKLEGYFLVDGVAACQLTYLYLNTRVKFKSLGLPSWDTNTPFKPDCFNSTNTFDIDYAAIPKVINLLGQYDVFDKSRTDWNIVMNFQYGIRSNQTNPRNPEGFKFWKDIFDEIDLFYVNLDSSSNKIVSDYCNIGKYVFNYMKSHSNIIGKSYGYEVNWKIEDKDYRCLVVNAPGNNMLFEPYKDEGYDLFISWTYKGEVGFKVSVSTSDNTGIDVSKIVKKFGGGGHEKIGGFTCQYLPFHDE